MWTRQVRTFLAKDARLHGRAAAVVIVGTLIAIATLVVFIPQGVGPQVALVFNINFLLALLWSEWLITRERSKGTFAWLRTLPTDDRALAGSKFVASAGLTVLLWTLSTTLFAREFWRPVGTWIVLLTLLLTFGGLAIAAKWRFSWRVGHIGPLLAFAAPLLLFMTVAGDGTERRDALIALWNAPWGRTVVSVAFCLVYVAIVVITTRWVTRADTVDLVD
ncbi:MAG TPA: hypothetical protein EYQ83_00855 [Acidobacteria bacterium]|nr:hypothetical protein [Acidobacteriota bacterium]